MRKKYKKKGSIFIKLVISYLLFLSVVVVIFIVGGLIELMAFSGGDDINRLLPSETVMENGSLGPLDAVYSTGGWVEKLDEDYRVIEVFGEKKTAEDCYTERQLLEATRYENAKSEYHFIWEPFEGGSYLFCYPKDAVSILLNFQIGMMELSPAAKSVEILMLILLVADGGIASFYIYRKIRKPLKQICKGMSRVTKGEENVRLSLQTEGEFMEIVDAFNGMLERLEQEKSEREKVQRERNQMLLELSHDLKTPIATIKSSAVALSEGVVKEENLAHYYETIARKSDRVNQMADDMFTMLKMESSDYCPDMKKIDFCEIVRQICAEYYEEMSRFEVEINIPENEILVMADERLITRTVANLVTNAIKYNQTGSGIRIEICETRESVSLVISDDGAEIADNVRENMFKAFVRGDASRRTTGGTGLGLAIAKGIAKKHGGDVTYRYEKGWNCFCLTLPMYFKNVKLLKLK
ncbi:MAG: HAMP domain-containing sensor histidine kinase [Clostridiales bacterium]|nr:HAMP domain-containing sensor histidine kinase [Clostridiales bacterium]